MVRAAPLLIALTLMACSGDDEPQPIDTDTGAGTTTGDPFAFKSSLPATDFKTSLPADAIMAQQMSNTFLAATALVTADEKVQGQMRIDGGSSARADLRCWERPDFPMFSFDLNYQPCTDFQIDGGVFITDHPSGPLLFQFNNLSLTGRQLGGTLALDTRDAFEGTNYWQVYNTSIDTPGKDNRVAIGATVDGVNAGIQWDGGANVNFLNQEWATWGVMKITPADTEYTIIHGGRTAEDVPPNDPPGADSVKSPLNWLECRCPHSGITTYELSVNFDEITIDLDDIQEGTDTIDDPLMVFPVEESVPGKAIITWDGCGEYSVEFEAEATTIEFTEDQLVGNISYLCDNLSIDDTSRCLEFIQAARDIGGVTVEIAQEDLQRAAKKAVETDFDNAWCKYY